MSTWIWVDGRVLPAEQATVAADDRGLLLGEGVYETVVVQGSTPFALPRHLDRLRASAKIVGIPLPWSDDDLTLVCTQTIATAREDQKPSDPPTLRMRITVTGGSDPMGHPDTDTGPRLLVMVAPGSPHPATAAVAVSPWPVNEMSPLVGAKVTSRLGYGLALADARARGADEAVLLNTRGMLVEGATTNLFLVVAGRLSTPSLATGCLGGVTRSLVSELVTVNERHDLTVDDLRFATEAFLTSTTRGVQPISSVDGSPLRSAPGPLTSAARSALESLRATTLDA